MKTVGLREQLEAARRCCEWNDREGAIRILDAMLHITSVAGNLLPKIVLHVDHTLPPGTAEFRAPNGDVLGRIVNLLAANGVEAARAPGHGGENGVS